MLIKSELQGIPLLPVPNLSVKSTGTKSYLTAVEIFELPKSGRVLVADIFRVKDNSFAARFYSDGKSYYTCLEYPVKHWCKCNPAVSYWYATYSANYPEATKLAEQFLGTKSRESWRTQGALAAIDVFISSLQAEKRHRAEERRNALEQTHMAMFPALPADLEQYCDENVFPTRYMFFNKLTKTGRRYGRCSCCGAMSRISRDVKHNQVTVCPKCGERVAAKAVYHAPAVEERSRICITANVDQQLLIRWTDVVRVITSDAKKSYTFSDYAYNLYCVNKGKPVLYAYEHKTLPYYSYKLWHRHRNGTQNFSKVYLYTNNLEEVFGANYYNVDLKAALHGKQGKVCLTELLNNLKNYPAAEYLLKLGLTQLAERAGDLVKISGSKKTGFSEVLQVSKQLLPMYQALNIDFYEHTVIQRYGQWVSADDMMQFRELDLKSDISVASELLQTMSFGKFVRYFSKQKAQCKCTTGHLLTQYRDYISMAKKLNLDLSRKGVRYPDDICEAHDLILGEFNKLKYKGDNEAFVKAVKPIYKRLPISNFENDAYCIVFPQLRSDFVTEGSSLRHCVGSDDYCNNHMKGTKMIFFVRRKSEPGKAFFTMEVNMETGVIIQLHGYGNKAAPRDVKQFAESFVKKLVPGRKEKKRRNVA